MRISDWSPDVCSSDLDVAIVRPPRRGPRHDTRVRNVARAHWAGALEQVEDVAPEAVVVAQPVALLVVAIGRASCRERVCQYVSISVVAVAFKKKQEHREDVDEHLAAREPQLRR